jgi:putative ABC transport system permease protein
MQSIASRLAATHEFNKNTGIAMVPLREELTGQVRSSLLVLYGAVAVLQLIVCFNVTNLLLARAATRRREIALRTSLGAGRMAIVRQLLVESLLLSVSGGLLGMMVARWTLSGLLALVPPNLLRAAELHVDLRVLGYALSLSVLTGVVIGLVPAMLAARQSIIAALRASGSSITHAPQFRRALLVCQVAMTVILLSGAAMLGRSLMALHDADNGVDRHNILSMEIGLPAARYNAERRIAFFRDLASQLRTLPGVEAVAATNSLPVIGGVRGGTIFHRLGTPQLSPNDSPSAVIRVVTPDYFRTLRIPVIKGREFTDADASATPGFIVNESFARTYLKDLDPLTTSLSVWMQQENPHAPIIGVVGDVSEGSVRKPAEPTIFYSHRQLIETFMTMVLRAAGDAARQTAPALAMIRRIDPNLAVSNVRTFDQAVSESLAQERLSALVSGAFALTALLLVSLGLYGLLAYLVTERTKELGIRIALGAHVGRLTRGVVGGGLKLVSLGVAVGLVVGYALLRSLDVLLFGVTHSDPSTYALVVGVLAIVATLAAYIPARRAARIEPLIALRQD